MIKKRFPILLSVCLIILCAGLPGCASRTDKVDTSPSPTDTVQTETTDAQSQASTFKIYHDDDLGIEFEYEDIRCVSKKTYEKVVEISSHIDFMGNFEPINFEEDSFREQYLKVLKGEETYIDIFWDSAKAFDPQNMKEYTYFYFDMDGDSVPELIVSGGDMRFIYFFSFNTKINKVELFDYEYAGYYYFLGNNKMGAWYNGTGLSYEFYEVDKNANRNYKICFHSEGYFNDITEEEDAIYLVGFGEDSEEFENYISLAKEMGEQLFERSGRYFLRISKEQYDQVTQDYFEAREAAEENIKKVTYTFDELFG